MQKIRCIYYAAFFFMSNIHCEVFDRVPGISDGPNGQYIGKKVGKTYQIKARNDVFIITESNILSLEGKDNLPPGRGGTFSISITGQGGTSATLNMKVYPKTYSPSFYLT